LFAAGIGQGCFCTAIIGGLAYRFGSPLLSPLILGLSLSSTAVVLQLMSERDAVGSAPGQASFSMLVPGLSLFRQPVRCIEAADLEVRELHRFGHPGKPVGASMKQMSVISGGCQ
jgi:hypothetical protein